MVKTMERKETIGNVVYYAPTNIEQEDWLSSKEYRFAVYMSECKIKQVDGNYRNCNIFNNLKYKTLEHNFKLGKNFEEFK